MIRVLVCGGRNYTNQERLFSYLDKVLQKHTNVTIIQGGAQGADRLAKQWADSRLVKCLEFKADWDNLTYPDAIIKTNSFGKKYDAKAGSRRNQLMLDSGLPDVVLAFEGGSGTADMVRRAISELGPDKVFNIKD